ncbi:MAG: sigma-70 family RNA polymerase sigma factor [Spirochaetia bacterium]|jgi:RNA polymerase sigma-70 factor (ECF subfamily)
MIQNESIDVEALYFRYGPMVFRRCRQLLGSDDMAADAQQETFVRVLRRRDSLHARHASSLLYRIATNICLNVMRGIRRRPTVSVEPLLDGLAGRERMEDRILDSFVLDQVFSTAREGTRLAAEMHYLEGCTLAETAEEVDLSISGVRKRLRALREQGRALMGGHTWREI